MGKQDLIGFVARLSSVKVVGLDTSVFLYYFEDNPTFRDLCHAVFERLEQRKLSIVTSVVTHTELLTGPRHVGNGALGRRYHEFLTTTPDLLLIPYTLPVSDLAAAWRARYGWRLPDAVQVASAVLGGAQVFVTNDRRLKQAAEFIPVIVLRDFL